MVASRTGGYGNAEVIEWRVAGCELRVVGYELRVTN